MILQKYSVIEETVLEKVVQSELDIPMQLKFMEMQNKALLKMQENKSLKTVLLTRKKESVSVKGTENYYK